MALQKIARVVKKGSKWCVLSEKGKSLGCYPTKAKAVRRLRQVEWFKHHASAVPLEPAKEASVSFLSRVKKAAKIVYATSVKLFTQAAGDELDAEVAGGGALDPDTSLGTARPELGTRTPAPGVLATFDPYKVDGADASRVTSPTGETVPKEVVYPNKPFTGTTGLTDGLKPSESPTRRDWEQARGVNEPAATDPGEPTLGPTAGAQTSWMRAAGVVAVPAPKPEELAERDKLKYIHVKVAYPAGHSKAGEEVEGIYLGNIAKINPETGEAMTIVKEIEIRIPKIAPSAPSAAPRQVSPADREYDYKYVEKEVVVMLARVMVLSDREIILVDPEKMEALSAPGRLKATTAIVGDAVSTPDGDGRVKAIESEGKGKERVITHYLVTLADGTEKKFTPAEILIIQDLFSFQAKDHLNVTLEIMQQAVTGNGQFLITQEKQVVGGTPCIVVSVFDQNKGCIVEIPAGISYKVEPEIGYSGPQFVERRLEKYFYIGKGRGMFEGTWSDKGAYDRADALYRRWGTEYLLPRDWEAELEKRKTELYIYETPEGTKTKIVPKVRPVKSPEIGDYVEILSTGDLGIVRQVIQYVDDNGERTGPIYYRIRIGTTPTTDTPPSDPNAFEPFLKEVPLLDVRKVKVRQEKDLVDRLKELVDKLRPFSFTPEVSTEGKLTGKSLPPGRSISDTKLQPILNNLSTVCEELSKAIQNKEVVESDLPYDLTLTHIKDWAKLFSPARSEYVSVDSRYKMVVGGTQEDLQRWHELLHLLGKEDFLIVWDGSQDPRVTNLLAKPLPTKGGPLNHLQDAWTRVTQLFYPEKYWAEQPLPNIKIPSKVTTPVPAVVTKPKSVSSPEAPGTKQSNILTFFKRLLGATVPSPAPGSGGGSSIEIGTRVTTPKGEGRIRSIDVAESSSKPTKYRVELASGNVESFEAKDVAAIDVTKIPKPGSAGPLIAIPEGKAIESIPEWGNLEFLTTTRALIRSVLKEVSSGAFDNELIKLHTKGAVNSVEELHALFQLCDEAIAKHMGVLTPAERAVADAARAKEKEEKEEKVRKELEQARLEEEARKKRLKEQEEELAAQVAEEKAQATTKKFQHRQQERAKRQERDRKELLEELARRPAEKERGERAGEALHEIWEQGQETEVGKQARNLWDKFVNTLTSEEEVKLLQSKDPRTLIQEMLSNWAYVLLPPYVPTQREEPLGKPRPTKLELAQQHVRDNPHTSPPLWVFMELEKEKERQYKKGGLYLVAVRSLFTAFLDQGMYWVYQNAPKPDLITEAIIDEVTDLQSAWKWLKPAEHRKLDKAAERDAVVAAWQEIMQARGGADKYLMDRLIGQVPKAFAQFSPQLIGKLSTTQYEERLAQVMRENPELVRKLEKKFWNNVQEFAKPQPRYALPEEQKVVAWIGDFDTFYESLSKQEQLRVQEADNPKEVVNQLLVDKYGGLAEYLTGPAWKNYLKTEPDLLSTGAELLEIYPNLLEKIEKHFYEDLRKSFAREGARLVEIFYRSAAVDKLIAKLAYQIHAQNIKGEIPISSYVLHQQDLLVGTLLKVSGAATTPKARALPVLYDFVTEELLSNLPELAKP